MATTEESTPLSAAEGCRCQECAAIHSEFISQFGRWPTMSHEEGQALRARREDNEASWRRAVER